MLEALVGLILLSAPATRLAVTLDDLPLLGSVGPGDTRAAATDRILAALQAHRAAVTGFVTCGKAGSDEELGTLLRKWVAAGAELGNHTQSHRSLDKGALAAWLEDVKVCHERLARVLGHGPEFFRYPFLQEGGTRELRDGAASALAKLGYRIGQVSVDTSDWALAGPYVDALARGDRAQAERIGRAYVQHVSDAASHYRHEAQSQLGHDIAHVLLLHGTALAADWLGAALDRLTSDGFAFVGLQEALADPVYSLPEKYVGRIGLSWLYRIRPDAADLWHWDDAQTDLLNLEFGQQTLRIDDDMVIRAVAPATFVVVHARPYSANTLVAVMPDGALLLGGSPYEPTETWHLLDWLREHFPGRRLVAIDTHFHLDGGGGGNGAYAEAGATVYGSDLTAKLLRERARPMQGSDLDWLGDAPALRSRFEGFVRQPPNRTFPLERGLTLHFGGEEVDVRFPGRAHSPDNVVVWFPARSVLFGGCAVVAMPKMGNLEDADLESWPAALEVMRSFHPRLVIPGHDQPGDVGLLDHTLALLRELHAQAVDGRRAKGPTAR